MGGRGSATGISPSGDTVDLGMGFGEINFNRSDVRGAMQSLVELRVADLPFTALDGFLNIRPRGEAEFYARVGNEEIRTRSWSTAVDYLIGNLESAVDMGLPGDERASTFFEGINYVNYRPRRG